MKKNLVGQLNICVKSNEEAEDIGRKSYILSKKKAGYSKTFYKECLIELIDTLYPDERKRVQVSLSKITVKGQIDAIVLIIKVSFGKVVETSVAFSIVLDESTDIIDTAQLAIFIRAVVQNYRRLACAKANLILMLLRKKTQS